jgi:hypothetical protein
VKLSTFCDTSRLLGLAESICSSGEKLLLLEKNYSRSPKVVILSGKLSSFKEKYY